ncbi:YbaN family protein [Chloroflexota bacterium]
MVLANFKRRLLIIAGTLLTAIGILGIFVPILPTTPFLLLAAICYARSSQRFYHWLLNNRLFGAYISNYLQGKGMPIRMKIFTLILLWATITISIIFAVHNLVVELILLSVGIGITLHIFLIKTLKKN